MMKDKTVAGKPVGLDHPDGSGKVYVEIIFLSSIKGCAAWFDSPARPVREERGSLYISNDCPYAMMSVLSRYGVLVILWTVQERSSWAETRWTSEPLALHRHGEVHETAI